MNTTPRPCSAEPCCDVEVIGVDGFEARFLDRESQEASTGCNDGRRSFGAHVALRQQAHAVRPDLLDPAHARDLGKVLRQTPAVLRLDLDVEAAAQHLAAELRDRAHQHDAAFVEQRDAIADALHTLQQM